MFMKREKKNSLAYLFSFVFFINTLNLFCNEKDTTLVFAMEICSDSTLINCWNINETGHYNVKGVFVFDTIKNKVNYDAGYFIYYSLDINPQNMDSINYLGWVGLKNENAMDWLTKVQVPFDSLLSFNFSSRNIIVLNETKNKRKNYKYYKKNNLMRSDYNFEKSQKIFFIFIMNVEYEESKIQYSDRYIVNTKGAVKFQKMKYYTILKVNKLTIPTKDGLSR